MLYHLKHQSLPITIVIPACGFKSFSVIVVYLILVSSFHYNAFCVFNLFPGFALEAKRQHRDVHIKWSRYRWGLFNPGFGTVATMWIWLSTKARSRLEGQTCPPRSTFWLLLEPFWDLERQHMDYPGLKTPPDTAERPLSLLSLLVSVIDRSPLIQGPISFFAKCQVQSWRKRGRNK